jgi:hypothetical protein
MPEPPGMPPIPAPPGDPPLPPAPDVLVVEGVLAGMGVVGVD